MLVVHTTKGSPVIVLGRATWRLYSDSPRDGAIIFGDLIGKLDALRVACDNCGRGRYPLQRLIDDRGRDAKVVDWLDELTADCWKKTSHNIGDQCGARCPDLPRVL
jgi:hypothetical protein